MNQDSSDERMAARIAACRRKVADNARFVRWMLQLWAFGQLMMFVCMQLKSELGSALGGVVAVSGILGGAVGWFRRYLLKSALARAEHTEMVLRSGISNDL